MNTQYTVWTVAALKSGEFALSGSVKGPFVSVGQIGSALEAGGQITVLIIGIGVSDRNLQPKDRQGILVKMLEGDTMSLKGLTLEFGELI